MTERHRLRAVMLLCIVAMTVAGCGSILRDTPTPGSVQPGAGTVTPQCTLVGGRQMKLGEICELRLSGNLTTGFSWEVAQIDDKVIRLLSTDYVSDVKGGTPLVGAGGTFVFRFEAAGAGQTTVTLVYHRPWEKGVEPLQTHTLEIVVQ